MQKYRWRVSCGENSAEVVAVDKLRAIQAAAQSWGLRWTNIARACICEQEGDETTEKKISTRGGNKNGRKRNDH